MGHHLVYHEISTNYFEHQQTLVWGVKHWVADLFPEYPRVKDGVSEPKNITCFKFQKGIED